MSLQHECNINYWQIHANPWYKHVLHDWWRSVWSYIMVHWCSLGDKIVYPGLFIIAKYITNSSWIRKKRLRSAAWTASNTFIKTIRDNLVSVLSFGSKQNTVIIVWETCVTVGAILCAKREWIYAFILYIRSANVSRMLNIKSFPNCYVTKRLDLSPTV